MKKMQVSMPTSLGEIINYKYHLDLIKNQYSEIKLSFNKSLWDGCLHTEASDWKYKETLWNKYLDDIGKLFFTEHPYVLTNEKYPFYDMGSFSKAFGIAPKKSEMGKFLCKGKSLNLNEEYIVITTKVRQVDRNMFYSLSFKLWQKLIQLSKKYKIVVLGERIVEMRKEYDVYKNSIFGLYEQIISNIPADRVLDLTVPALGETVADLTDIQQDCLIMKEAKFVITIGIGGNFCMASSTADMIVGFRSDDLQFTDIIFKGREYPNAIVTKDWNYFISVLDRYN